VIARAATLAAAALLVLAGHGVAFAADCATTTPGTERLAGYPAVRAFYDALTTGDADLVDCAVAAGWTNTPAAPGTPAGPDGFKPSVLGVHAAFSQYEFRTEDVVVDGGKVVVRSTVTATQAGDFLGVKAGGNPAVFQTIDIHQLDANGKIAQSWHVEDWLSFLFQRGALPIKQ
jgi:predicted ester cyclase